MRTARREPPTIQDTDGCVQQQQPSVIVGVSGADTATAEGGSVVSYKTKQAPTSYRAAQQCALEYGQRIGKVVSTQHLHTMLLAALFITGRTSKQPSVGEGIDKLGRIQTRISSHTKRK